MNASGLAAGFQFFGRLPFYLHQRVSLENARAGVEQRLRHRADRLLDRFRHEIYDEPDSVYHGLLRYVGIEYGDVETLVSKEGVDGALAILFRAGVYMTVDEFKGRKTLRRGRFECEVDPALLRSPRASYHVRGSSGGSRSQGTPVLIDLRFIRDCGANCSLLLDAWGITGAAISTYESPGAGARFRLVKFAAFGTGPEGWFTQIRNDDPTLPAVVRWNTIAMRAASILSGRALPPPVYTPLSDPEPPARWIASVLRDGRIPMLFTFPSSALRACAAARARGLDLTGARFLLAGEPITAARVATVRQTGAIPIPRYGTLEVGAIGYGCPHGSHPDDLHLVSDIQALIHAGPDAPDGLPERAVLLTTLHVRSPFLMINVSMGDQATLERSSCGCPLETLGWTTRVHSVDSFEKLTTGGMTFLGSDIVRILEEELPSRFGGKPTDYQLVEREAADGQPLLDLVASPTLGDQDETALAEAFLTSLAQSSAVNPTMVQFWREGKTLRVVRRLPITTKSGKILHLQRGGPI